MTNCNECKRKLSLLEKRHKLNNSVVLCESCFIDMQKKIKQQRRDYIKKYISKNDIDFLSKLYEIIPYWLEKMDEYNKKRYHSPSRTMNSIQFQGLARIFSYPVMSNDIDGQMITNDYDLLKKVYEISLDELETYRKKNMKKISIEERTNLINTCKIYLKFLEDIEKLNEYFIMKKLDFQLNYITIISELFSLIELPQDLILKKKETPDDKIGELEKDLFSKKDKKITIPNFENINGYDFEAYLKNLFTKLGYTVIQTPKSGDQGADLIISKNGIKTVVQAKRYIGSVSNKAIQEIVASKKYYNAEKSLVVTTGDFTKSAFELAQVNDVELWDRKKLDEISKNL